MIDSFIFEVDLPLPSGKARTTCVFLPYANASVQKVKGILQDYLDVDGKVPPDVVLFVGTAGLQKEIDELCNSDLIRDCLPEITRRSCPPPVRGIVSDLSGKFSSITEESAPFAKPACIEQIREHGMLALIQRHEIVLAGNDRFHFVKPAGTHCASFIRSANAFVSGAGTLFAALWLLPYIKSNTHCIYTDTAGINAFALSALLLRLQIDPQCKIPIVDSFGSYSGLSGFEFRYPHQSLFVISSSTSAGLERALTNRLHVPASQIVTVFFLDSGDRNRPGIMLCNILPDYERRTVEFASFAGDDCPLCKSHVPAVAIGGDQFLLDVSSPEAVLLKVDDVPEWLYSLTEDFVGKDVFKVHRIVRSGANRPRELFIDLERVLALPEPGQVDPFANSTYHRILNRRLQTNVPSSLKHIVYIGDQGSKALAERIRNRFSVPERDAVNIIPRTEVPKSGIKDSPLSTGTLMVVGGVLISGQSMMEVNQLLRDRDEDAVTYLSGMTRTRDQKRLGEIVSNIQYGYDGGRHYGFTSILDIFLPDNHIERPSPWDREAETWRSIRESLLQQTDADDLREWCAKRVRYLEQSRAIGMGNKLFLGDNSGGELCLRKGFAFWPDIPYREGSYSQADVYFSVAATLHNWRRLRGTSQDGGRRRLLLSPRVFFRFNDGIIQACLLRACAFGELDYRSSRDLSEAMAEVLSVVFSHCQDTQGEATLEFLLALKEHRLVIQKEMLSGLLWELEEQLADSNDLFARLAKKLSGKVLADIERGVNLNSGSLVDKVKGVGRKRKRSAPSGY
jgi:hypothetical protein